MFYLLEDNRIVDSKELIKEYKRKANFSNLNIETNKKNELYLFYINNKNIKYIVTNLGKIKKQSKNIFDLIEKGDLVNTIVDSIYQVVIIEKNTIIAPQWTFDLAVVTAIYKPNSKGDYIKVWEVKEDD